MAKAIIQTDLKVRDQIITVRRTLVAISQTVADREADNSKTLINKNQTGTAVKINNVILN